MTEITMKEIQAIKKILNGGKKPSDSTPRVEIKRLAQCYFFINNKDNLEKFLSKPLKEGIKKKAKDLGLMYHGKHTVQKLFNLNIDWWRTSKKMHFVKVRMSKLVRIFEYLGIDKISIPITPKLSPNRGSIKLSEVKSLLENKKFNKEERALLRQSLSESNSLRRVYVPKGFGMSPLITVLMFLEIVGYEELIIDVKSSYELYKNLNVL